MPLSFKLPEETRIEQDLINIARFYRGNVSTTGLILFQKKLLMILCLELYTRWQTCFQKTDFTYTQDYKGEKAGYRPATGTVTIEGSVYSMDSPAVMQVLLHRHTIEILQTVKTKTS
jgi:hypothetical protein